MSTQKDEGPTHVNNSTPDCDWIEIHAFCQEKNTHTPEECCGNTPNGAVVMHFTLQTSLHWHTWIDLSRQMKSSVGTWRKNPCDSTILNMLDNKMLCLPSKSLTSVKPELHWHLPAIMLHRLPISKALTWQTNFCSTHRIKHINRL